VERHSTSTLHPYFAANLRYWRESRGLSVADLAAKAQLSVRLVYLYEAGSANPRYPSALKLSHALGVRIENLWDHRPPPIEDPGQP
jgi:transcriptional regulator with XRE-family HTH domain